MRQVEQKYAMTILRRQPRHHNKEQRNLDHNAHPGSEAFSGQVVITPLYIAIWLLRH